MPAARFGEHIREQRAHSECFVWTFPCSITVSHALVTGPMWRQRGGGWPRYSRVRAGIELDKNYYELDRYTGDWRAARSLA